MNASMASGEETGGGGGGGGWGGGGGGGVVFGVGGGARGPPRLHPLGPPTHPPTPPTPPTHPPTPPTHSTPAQALWMCASSPRSPLPWTSCATLFSPSCSASHTAWSAWRRVSARGGGRVGGRARGCGCMQKLCACEGASESGKRRARPRPPAPRLPNQPPRPNTPTQAHTTPPHPPPPPTHTLTRRWARHHVCGRRGQGHRRERQPHP